MERQPEIQSNKSSPCVWSEPHLKSEQGGVTINRLVCRQEREQKPGFRAASQSMFARLGAAPVVLPSRSQFQVSRWRGGRYAWSGGAAMI